MKRIVLKAFAAGSKRLAPLLAEDRFRSWRVYKFFSIFLRSYSLLLVIWKVEWSFMLLLLLECVVVVLAVLVLAGE